jgi:dihydrofolate synthase/folylpolyglutamate synthase
MILRRSGPSALASWPARLQRLEGSLSALLPVGFSLWLDGGHNAGAGQALAQQFT